MISFILYVIHGYILLSAIFGGVFALAMALNHGRFYKSDTFLYFMAGFFLWPVVFKIFLFDKRQK